MWNPDLDPNADPEDRNVAMWAQVVPGPYWNPAGPDIGLRTPGFLFQYASNAGEIVDCPTNKRRNNTGTEITNIWNQRSGVQFDYTMLDELEGIYLHSQARVGYLAPGSATPAVLPSTMAPNLTAMPGVPLFFEESVTFYNQTYRDGMFGNVDQVATRHTRGGHVAYLDGSTSLFKPPSDKFDDIYTPSQDFVANLLYIASNNNARWFKLSDPPNGYGYGWANSPR